MKQLLTLMALVPLCALAQTFRQPLSIKYTSHGSYSKNFADAFSATANQAALAQLKSGAFGAYGERRFLLHEFSQYSAIVALPSASGTFALQGDYFGFSSFNESQLGFAYGRRITSQVDAGLKFNYHSVTVPGYGSSSAINFEGGALLHLTDQLHAGFHLYNPFGSKFSKNNSEQLPSIFKTGIGYEVSPQFFISGEVVMQQNIPASVNAGFQYNIQQSVFVRGGISTLGNNSYAGAGLKLGQLRIDINAAYHQQLGFSPGLLLLYQFKKEVND